MHRDLDLPNLSDVRCAQSNLVGLVHKTPLMSSALLTERTNVKRLLFKCENLQKTGSFKARGATNAVFQLSKDKSVRVATHSSGNHGAALSAAAKTRGIEAHIVIPRNAPEIKKSVTRSYGANVTECDATLQAREQTLDRVVIDTGAKVVHPYDDSHVIAGQGTMALEIISEVSDLDILLVPVGGGGLLSGSAMTMKQMNPKVSVIGVEPLGADDAARSFKAGRIIPQESPKTIADGLLTSLGERNFSLIRTYVDDIITVDEKSILDAMYLICSRLKQLVEPSGAVSYAALLGGATVFKDKTVVAVLSGGNVDPQELSW